MSGRRGEAPASEPPAMPLVVARGLRKSYRRGPEVVHALRGVSFELTPGELVVLVGPSGSGKSTLLGLLCGWEEPDGGEVAWTASSPSGSGRGGVVSGGFRRRPWHDVGIVPQRLGLIEELSVRENVGFPVRLGRTAPGAVGLDEAEGARRVEALLRSLGLSQLADRSPAEISMGERQRAALARALVLLPRLLLADEPTGHQDEGWSKGVLTVLALAVRRGAACLLATHNKEALRVADRALAIRDGRLRPLARASRPTPG